MKNILGKRIKQLREEKDLSQLEFAKILNISNSTLSQYEAGNRVPSDDIKKKIADLSGTTVDYLLGNSDIRNPYNEDKEEYIVPEEFIDPIKAREYVNKHQIFGFSGFDSDKLDEEEIVRFANELLEQMKMVSYKYKK